MLGRIRHSVLVIAALSALAAPVCAQQQPGTPPPKEPFIDQTERAFRQSIETILKALEKLVSSVPLYEAPEVLENGDIIIRRKHPDKAPKDQKQEKPDGTSRT